MLGFEMLTWDVKPGVCVSPLGSGYLWGWGTAGPEITCSVEGGHLLWFYTTPPPGGLTTPFFEGVSLTFIELLLFAARGQSAAY